MEHTLVAVFDNETHAQDALNALLAAGIARDDMHINASQQREMAQGASDRADNADQDRETIGEKIRSFFHEMFGTEGEHAKMYAEAAQRGNYVLTVRTGDEDRMTLATDVLNRHNPIDVEDRATQWKDSGQTPGTEDAAYASGRSAAMSTPDMSTASEEMNAGTAARSPTEESAMQGRSDNDAQSIPDINLEFLTGKRVVQRGSVRVVQQLTEDQIEGSIPRFDEPSTMERASVVQSTNVAGTAGMTEAAISARPDAAQTDLTLDDTDFRTHWQKSFAQSGGRYEDYAPAYRYGYTMHGDEQYRNRSWEEVEPQVRADWEAKHAGSPWEQAKDAVRAGWEKLTG